MRVGDIDGRNVVYRLTSESTCLGHVVNYSGTAVLESGERLLFFKREVLPEIMGDEGEDRFHHFLYPTSDGLLVNFYPGVGWGTMYFTDRRMLFLRRPDVRQLLAMYGNSSMFEVPRPVLDRTRHVEMRGGMEYLEIPYEDVLRYERGAFFARIWVRKSPERECVIRLPRKVFDRIASLLDARGVPGKRRHLSIAGIPKVRLGLVVLMMFSAMKGFLDDDFTYILLAFALGLFALMIFSVVSGGGLRRAKATRWESGIWSRIGKWAAYSIAGTFFVCGATISYLMHSLAPIIFCLFCGGVFLVVGLALRWDWSRTSEFRKRVPYRYKCPSCRAALTRRDIGCPKCGAPVWWTQVTTMRMSRRKQMRWNVVRR